MVAPSTVASRLDGLVEPVKLSEWWPNNNPSEELMWRSGYEHQCHYVGRVIAYLFASDCYSHGSRLGDIDRDAIDNASWVISTHTSKSVTLPVFKLVHPTRGLELIMRYNFFDWKVSVISDTPVQDNFFGLFDPTLKINAVYCEGFDQAWVFGSYTENPKQFTIELGGDHMLYTFIWLLLGGQKR